MNKKLIRLTESDLHRIVKESVNNVLNEGVSSAWDAIERSGYDVYDNFVDFLKNFYANGNRDLAYQIEDEIGDKIMNMIRELDAKYIV